MVEHLGHAGAGLGIGEFGISGIDIGGQAGFLDQPVTGILVSGIDGFGADAEVVGDLDEEALVVAGLGGGGDALVGEVFLVAPDRLVVAAPVE